MGRVGFGDKPMEEKTARRLESNGRRRPTPEQWGFIAHQLGELTPDVIGVERP